MTSERSGTLRKRNLEKHPENGQRSEAIEEKVHSETKCGQDEKMEIAVNSVTRPKPVTQDEN